MDCVKGCIVKAAAGHDAGRFFIVLDTEGEYLFLADGKRRKVEKPKKKKHKHVFPTAHIVPVTAELTNKQARFFLHPFNYGEKSK